MQEKYVREGKKGDDSEPKAGSGFARKRDIYTFLSNKMGSKAKRCNTVRL